MDVVYPSRAVEFAMPEQSSPINDGWDIETESIVVRIRWVGIAMGGALAVLRSDGGHPWTIAAILALGAGYAALDTAWYLMGDVFLGRLPLFVSAMESVFIGLLCYHDHGIESPFRWYYVLSLICCAIRFRPIVAWSTFGMHAISLLWLETSFSGSLRMSVSWVLLVALLGWATWATSALSGVFRAVRARLERANSELASQRSQLERRVAERTAELRAAQARTIQQEKMAAFGLLAAGIAHEVGNPLAAVSSIVQILKRREPDAYTMSKLGLVEGQLQRIERTIRDLVDFSRPANNQCGLTGVSEVVDEVRAIARYYQRMGDRRIFVDVDPELPAVRCVRDHLTQVLLNLVLNAIDATSREGSIWVTGRRSGREILLAVEDDGAGLNEGVIDRLFEPYITTKPMGTGLGLFVSRQLLQELGGGLRYEPRPGGGSRFIAALPIGAAESSLVVSEAMG
jgi:signal transduction histidine kinase